MHSAEKELNPITVETEGSVEARENFGEQPAPTLKEEDPALRWDLVILRQILICIFIIILLGLVERIPKIGSGMVERFRYVLTYGEAHHSQQKLYSFAQKQWEKVKDEVSSWFAIEVQEAIAPPSGTVRFVSPIYYFERRDFLPERVRFVLPVNSRVYASAPGTVVEINPGTEGWRLKIEHGTGWDSIYYPCPEVLVTRGEWVNAYQELGSSGRVFFWEVTHYSQPVNPRPLLEYHQGLWR
ncbi:MAG: M23 family metallopeptidase [Firmicutes bacterium]|nr:M23 family metallopeptidase [Bacillota bacterium]